MYCIYCTYYGSFNNVAVNPCTRAAQWESLMLMVRQFRLLRGAIGFVKGAAVKAKGWQRCVLLVHCCGRYSSGHCSFHPTGSIYTHLKTHTAIGIYRKYSKSQSQSFSQFS